MTTNDKRDFITIVSGLPRSGTSMMMKMMEAGGVPVLTDHIRTADEDNPKGYYEFERVKNLKNDKDWLPEAVGKVVKIISFLLFDLPPGYKYRVIFMRRDLDEVLASQRNMLIRRGEPTDEQNDERMQEIYEKHLKQVAGWMVENPDIQVEYVDYRDVIARPRTNAEKVNALLDGFLDVDAMTHVVDSSLYRQRA